MNNPFYFLRHGETQWNKDKICQGQMDSQLNDTGRAQAASAAVALKDEPIARIICSPLSRTRHTAEAVQKYHDLEIVFDDDLREVNLGDHQGEPLGSWSSEFWQGITHRLMVRPISNFVAAFGLRCSVLSRLARIL